MLKEVRNSKLTRIITECNIKIHILVKNIEWSHVRYLPAMNNDGSLGSTGLRVVAMSVYLLDEGEKLSGRVRGLVIWPGHVPGMEQRVFLVPVL